MTTLLSRPASFDGFGPSVLSRQTRGELTGHMIPHERLEARKLLRAECPPIPGVYGWLDSDRQLVYVGKSKALRSRLLTYFAKTPSDNKMLRIRQHSERLVWEPVSHELLALIREQELIHRWRPDFNKQGQPTRTQPAYLCISGGPAPNAFLARKTSPRSTRTFGPISGTNRLRQAIISLNQSFRLRDCPDKTRFEFNNQRTLFDDPATAKCIRYELGSCPAPCAGMCSARGYQENVQRAIDFLEGRDSSILLRLEHDMLEAARKQVFEVAAVLRDNLDHLTWLDRRLGSLRRAQTMLNGVVPIRTHLGRRCWLILRGGRLMMTAGRPDRASRAQQAEDRLKKIAQQTAELPTNLLEMQLQLIVISWFRKHPDQLAELMSFDTAIKACRDIFARKKAA
jgi:excinuclease ABC subunit C